MAIISLPYIGWGDLCGELPGMVQLGRAQPRVCMLNLRTTYKQKRRR